MLEVWTIVSTAIISCGVFVLFAYPLFANSDHPSAKTQETGFEYFLSAAVLFALSLAVRTGEARLLAPILFSVALVVALIGLFARSRSLTPTPIFKTLGQYFDPVNAGSLYEGSDKSHPELKWLNHNVPAQMRLNGRHLIVIKIRTSVARQQAQGIGANLEVFNVEFFGEPSFAISEVASNGMMQTLFDTEQDLAVWMWEVVPLEIGRHDLSIKISSAGPNGLKINIVEHVVSVVVSPK